MDDVIAETKFNGSFAEFCIVFADDRSLFQRSGKFADWLIVIIAKRIDPELIKLFGKLPRLPYG